MFDLMARDGKARRGRLHLKHGILETPVFMPVGTVGSVKTLVPRDLLELNASIILGNTYHLFLRPGLEVIRHFGGLHRFIGWDRPMLTDSGGFQIFSLAKNTKLTEEGALFSSHIDGTRFMLTPELAVHIQETLGSDIHMTLDECTRYPASVEEARLSMQRSMRWAERARKSKSLADLAQFGIVQGGVYPELRQLSAQELVAMNFEGYAIGGLSVGESREDMARFCRKKNLATSWASVRHWILLKPLPWASTCSIASCPPVTAATAICSPQQARSAFVTVSTNSMTHPWMSIARATPAKLFQEAISVISSLQGS